MATNTVNSFTNHIGNGTAGPFNVSFSNQLSSNSIFNWDFGNGNSSSDQFPNYSFEN